MPQQGAADQVSKHPTLPLVRGASTRLPFTTKSSLALQLNVGNTRFKTAMRELGMSSWPYRKIKSIRNLVNVVQTNPEQFHVSASALP